jgi:hypothetical protein
MKPSLTLNLSSLVYKGEDTVAGSVEMSYPMAIKDGIVAVQVKR